MSAMAGLSYFDSQFDLSDFQLGAPSRPGTSESGVADCAFAASLRCELSESRPVLSVRYRSDTGRHMVRSVAS